MQVYLEHDGETAVAIASVGRGWRHLKNTYGFCEEARLPVQADAILRIQASIHAWPNFLGSHLAHFPPAFGRIDRAWGISELRGDMLRIDVNLQRLRAEKLPKSGLPGIYEAPTEMDRPDRVGFWFSLLAIISPASIRDYPDVLEWNTQFLMGGRPGSNRRH
jgi:hypothetical protein